MPKCHRFLDINSAGGAVTVIPQSTVFANGRLVCVNGSIGTSHPPCPLPPIHCFGAWVTVAAAAGPPNVFAENIPVVRETDVDTCGHPRVSGSPNVFIN